MCPLDAEIGGGSGPPSGPVIGRPTKPVDWQDKTTGAARYPGDISLPGMAAAAMVRSPHPSARILRIDTEAARAIPGVLAVLTAGDLPDRTYIDYRPADADRRVLARDVVRHVGECVAAVAAEDAETAARAAKAVRVVYRPLPPVLTVQEALESGAPRVHADRIDNVSKQASHEFGDVPAARARTAAQVSARYRSSRQAHATMEPHRVVADWRPHERRLHMWLPSQAPRTIQRDVAQVLGLERDQVALHEVAIGGDFGGHTQVSDLEAIAGALSMACDRPVKLVHSRADEFAFSKSRLSWDLQLELGCDRTGKLTILRADADVDNGAYNQAGPGEMEYGLVALGSAYRLQSYEAVGRCVYTNKQSPSSFRGAGGYAINYALECLVDELAEQIGADPIDFRLMNALSSPGEKSITGWEVKSSRLADCLEAVRREIDWDAKRADGGKGRGVGVACSIHVTGLHREQMMRSSAALDVDPDGHVTLRSGSGDAGTGQKTLLCQTIAEILGISLDDVSIIATDTDETPHDAGAGASRGTFVSVSATKQLAETARDMIREAAAAKLHVEVADVRLVNGHAVAGRESVSIGDLAVMIRDPEEPCLKVTTDFLGRVNDVTAYGYEDVSPTYSFAAQAVEVDVDLSTGKVSVVKVVAAHDSGTILNPVTARGQVEGGVVMGLGAVLSEELIYEGGRAVNTSFVDYAMARAADAPEIQTIFLEQADEAGPFGAKGLGEITMLPTGAALANAVAHALGIRLRDAPFTPDRVLAAIRQRDGLPMEAGKRRLEPRQLWVDGIRWAYPRGLHALLHRYGPRNRSARVGARRLSAVHAAASGDEAATLLATHRGSAPIGGGTDLASQRVSGLPAPTVLIDVASSADLRSIGIRANGDLVVGGAVTLAELCTDASVDAVIRQTTEQIASPQIREAATVAGNLCQAKRCWFYRNGFDCYKRAGNARPCYAVTGDHRFHHAVMDAHRCQATTPSDLATTFIALDAELAIRSADAVRRIPMSGLYSGPGETTLRPGELVTEIVIPGRARSRETAYRKLSLWDGGFAVVSLAVSAERARSRTGLSDVRVAVGGVAPVPLRAVQVERRLLHGKVDAASIDDAVQHFLDSTHPLSENHWKAFAAGNMLRDTLTQLLLEDAS
jgi:CO/xanthine dehydrogenase Mo-binding subunit/CO/xanthine dehydrogenase FAD-binding subunit